MNYLRIKLLLLVLWLIYVPASSQDTIIAFRYYQKALSLQQANNSDSAAFYFSKSASIYKSTSSVIYAYSSFFLSDIFKTKSQYQKAYEILSGISTEQFKKTALQDILLAEYNYRLAWLLITLGNSKDAKILLSKAVIVLNDKKKSNADFLFKIYTNLVLCHKNLNEYESALKYFIQAKKMIPFLKKNKFDLAILYQIIGRTYLNLGDIDSARFYFIKSIEESKKYEPETPGQLGSFYSNTGIFYKNIGLNDEALKFYQLAENVFTKFNDKNNPELISIYSNIGSIYLMKGDYRHAEDYFQKSLFSLNLQKSLNPLLKITILRNLALVNMYVNDFEKAYKFLQESLKIYEKIPGKEKQEFIYHMFARYYTYKKNFKEARKYYLLHIKNLETVHGTDNPSTASAYLNYGQFLNSINEFSAAEYYLNKSLKLYQQHFGELHTFTSQSYTALGDLSLKINRITEAYNYYLKSLKSLGFQMHPEINDRSKFLSRYDLQILNNLRKISFALLKLSEKQKNKLTILQTAYQYLETAIIITEKLQHEYLSQESKLVINAGQQATLNRAIEVSLNLYKLTKDKKYLEASFKYMEKSKSAVLLSSLKDMQAKIFSNVPDSLMEKERKYNEDISIFKELISKEEQKSKPDTLLLQKWQNKIFLLNKQKEKLIEIYRKKYPAYFQTIYEEYIIPIAKIQSNLRKNQLLAEYFINDTTLYCFYISRTHAECIVNKIDSNFYFQVKELRKQLSNNKFDENAFENYRTFINASFYLYKVLLGNYPKTVRYRQLLIIPDDVLTFIPFEILLTNNQYEKKYPDYRKLDYLLHRHIIDYSYSSTLAFLNLKSGKKSWKKVLAFAPSYQDYQLHDLNKLTGSTNSKDLLLPLSGVDEEVENIRQLVDAKIIKGKSATETYFKKIAKDYGVLHLAMHTVIDHEHPQYSKLIFALSKDTLDDGLLNTYELYNLNLNSRLVVLSACNTGYGKVSKGEGVMSLARGFLYAGCLNIVMTLWPLEDRSGVAIMTDFYKQLRRSKNVSYALHKSKLNYLKNADKLKAHPYFWAGFVAIINHSPDNLLPIAKIFLLLVICSLLILLAYVYWKRKRASISAS